RIAQARPVTFMVFDVLRLYGVPLLERPFAERRATLERLDLASVPVVSLSPIYTDGAALLDATRERGMEGVVAKRRDGVYRPGRRSPSWTKVTHRLAQACVVGGWRPERGGSSRIGALLLGVPDGSAFAGPLPRAEAAGVRWCEPQTVVEVAHTGRTAAGRLWHPVFRGVRDDLDPVHVELEA